MLKKTIKYTDYNGVERTEDFYFNLKKAEIMEMQLTTVGGLDAYLKKIISAQDMPTLMRIFKDLILKSYGVKSDDGRRFIKNEKLREEFEQTEAYSILYMELSTDAESAAAFVNGIIPADVAKQLPKDPNEIAAKIASM